MTLLIAGGLVVRSLWPPVVEQADVVIGAERVLAVGRCQQAGGQRIDASGCLVMPGNVNAHMHAYSALSRGMPYALEPPTNFLEILQRVWWRLDRALDAESIRASAMVAAREALLAGTTTLIDHHASPNAIDGSLDVLAGSFEEAGLRAALCYEVSDRDGPERSRAGLDENERFIRDHARAPRRLTRPMVGAHACFTLSDETLASCRALADAHRVGLHIHAAEDGVDAGAVRRLAAAGALNERTLVAHAVHVDDDEIDELRASGAFVAHNARSNMNNGVGRSPVGALGVRVGLGTDGIGSDLFEETRAAFLRRRDEDISLTPDWAVERLATCATLAGRIFDEPLLGTIVTGAPADIVVLDYAPPTPLDPTNLAGHLVFGITSAAVRDVIVDGEVVVRDRHLTRVDEGQLNATAREQAARLWQRMAETPAHEFTPRGATTAAAARA